MHNIWQDCPKEDNIDELEKIKEIINAGIGLTALQAVYILKIQLARAKQDVQELAYMRVHASKLERENVKLKEIIDGFQRKM